MEQFEEQEDVFEDDLEILELIEYGFPRKIYPRSNYFETLDEFTFFRRFRLYKATAFYILTVIEADLEYPKDVNRSISPVNQLLATLRFFATGTHHSVLADFGGMHSSTVTRIIKRVSRVIARLCPQFIRMPSRLQIIQEQAKFYDIARFPKIIGVVDGTHIRIESPGGDDAEIFRNRKGYFSLNVQVTCGADMKINNIVARWPGSVHDVTIFINSNLRVMFENGEFPDSMLLGDGGYALKSYFLTPLAQPVTQGERNYNTSFNTTRNIVERTIGCWKRRFPCLAYGFRSKLENTLFLIVACAVLHNVAREMNEPEPPPPDQLDPQQLNYLIEAGNIPVQILPAAGNAVGQIVQRQLIDTYFSNL